MPLPQLVSRSVFFQTLIGMLLLAVCVQDAHASQSQLISNPRSLWFGKVVTGQNSTLPVSVTNTGSSSVSILEVSVGNPDFTVNNLTVPQTLTAGQKIQFSVTFSPTAVGNETGTVAFKSSVGTLYLSANGNGVDNWDLTASPASLNFGSVSVGGSSSLPLTINNQGVTTQTISIGKVGGAGFSVSGIKLPLILPAGQSFTFNVTLAPQSAGNLSGSLLATSPTNPTLIVPLTGMGAAAGQLTILPTAINFGNVNVGQNSSQSGQLTAGVSSVTVSTVTMSNSAFALSGITLPVTIAAGQSVNFTVTFTPQTGIGDAGTLSFASNAVNSPTVESLAGTGNPVQFSVNLSWDPSTSQVVGYNVYRGAQSGGPFTMINPQLDPNTAYTDSTVVDGQTYYYVTTAVNSAGQESSYSNLTEAVIP
jgi:hypothetical protein